MVTGLARAECRLGKQQTSIYIAQSVARFCSLA